MGEYHLKIRYAGQRDQDEVSRLKKLLKALLRQYGFECLDIKEQPQGKEDPGACSK